MPHAFNHNHVLYFWVTATEGSIARASENLHISRHAKSTLFEAH